MHAAQLVGRGAKVFQGRCTKDDAIWHFVFGCIPSGYCARAQPSCAFLIITEPSRVKMEALHTCMHERDILLCLLVGVFSHAVAAPCSKIIISSGFACASWSEELVLHSACSELSGGLSVIIFDAAQEMPNSIPDKLQCHSHKDLQLTSWSSASLEWTRRLVKPEQPLETGEVDEDKKSQSLASDAAANWLMERSFLQRPNS
ncbi:predicted protein [Histoplasma capsulatum G186AR]|uniref:Uncharacterized protein n=1 Tax=Ajellomyces capsulatus (strain G186AR / H82 / ATCC MYA-2454 / RMSCC 2432) TaxID=447093 RepID=C0NGK7_AJECG|nr:uncharacterized protein HCBG_02479 [Histoplasma capsulatum G186AR]EEH08942.1 predicted protein [Histoplasma capsulatum G186AR]